MTKIMSMNDTQWDALVEYSLEVFGQQDDHLASIMPRAVAEGLPDIAVSPEVGRLLMILTSMTDGRRAIEVGTLAGYSGIWIARGLRRDGRLATFELDDAHADIAQANFEHAGVADRVEIHRGPALDTIPALREAWGEDSTDVVFLDGAKIEYEEYWQVLRPMIKRGGLLLADNVFGTGGMFITDRSHEKPIAMDRFNRLIASDDEFETVAVPLRQGVMIARRN